MGFRNKNNSIIYYLKIPKPKYGMDIWTASKSISKGDMNPPIVQIAIPIAVAVDRTGVGNNSAATKNTAKNMITHLNNIK